LDIEAAMLKKNVLIPIANGIEELEAVTIIDVLRRANLGVRVTSIEERTIIGANSIKIVADSDFIDEVIEDYDAIVLPGGTEGAKRFAAYKPLEDALKKLTKNQSIVAAICASPALVLAHLGILDHVKATSYPSFKHNIKNYVDEKVVVDGHIITSQGPGTALAFAFKLVDILVGEEVTQKVKKGMLA
jgi:4-methyl-5(b-hydroxyethyl)-thiazole monophosphate biosynthesis